jgi:dipeptidyl aminopeptidase/acylaminoacyl peptidase
MSRFILFFFTIFLISVFVIFRFPSTSFSPPTIINSPVTPTPSSDTFHPYPYDLSHLASKIDPNTRLETIRDLGQTSSYRSRLVSYQSDGLTLYALLHQPLGTPPPSGWPVIIVNHGYIPPKSYSTLNSYRNTAAFYAKSGFLVLKPDYRGHDQSQGEPDLIFGRSQYALDVLNLLEAVDTIPPADPNRIYLYGHSMGGEVSLQVAEISPKVKALSLWAPATTTFPQIATHFLNKIHPTPTHIPTIFEQIRQLTRLVDPNQLIAFGHLGQINVPLIIHHGTADESVPYAWGESLNSKLKSLNKSVTFYSYPNANHDISSHWSQALSRDVEFFNKIPATSKP